MVKRTTDQHQFIPYSLEKKRSPLTITFVKEHLYLVNTPAYDPDVNRIEWLWRVSRRVVTHNHQRSTFDLLLKDLQTHFQTLARTPTEVLRHIGSPFAPDKETPLPLLAHAA